jgi:predicted nucleotidyltransferase
MADSTVIEMVSRYLSTIPSGLGLKKAYIFGSHAKGTQRTDSDIDVALVLSHMPDFFAVQCELMRLRRAIDLRIEPHAIREEDFNSSDPFAAEIVRTGIEMRA